MPTLQPRHLSLLVLIGLLLFAACRPATGPGEAGKSVPQLVVGQAGGAPPAVGNNNVVPVVVAAVDLPVGTLLRDPAKQLAVKGFLADTAPQEGLRLSDVEDLRNKTVGRNISKGEPITPRDLSQHGDLFRAAPPGLRAMTLKLEWEAAGGGFTLPGSRVDILALGPKEGKPTAWVVLQNVLVLATEQPVMSGMQPGKDVNLPKDRHVLHTVALKPVDGLKLAQTLAAPGTKLMFMLRRPGEDEAFSLPGETP